MSRISAKYLVKRLMYSYFTLLVIMTAVFLLMQSMPGDFIDYIITPDMPAETAQQLEKEWGLDQPLYVQYYDYMVNYHRLDFGHSPMYDEPVGDILARRAPRTLMLFGAAFIVGYIIGPIVGMYLGWMRGTSKDKYVFASSLVVYSMPSFWVAWLFIWLFNFELGLLPSAYEFTQFPDFEWTIQTTIRNALYHITLPLLSLAFVGWVGSMIVMRPTMINVTSEDYVFLAQAKGLSERTVMIKHAARNALIPVATQAIVGIAFIVDGSVLIESVFSWPGIGDLLVRSVFENDFAIAQATFFILAIIIITMRLLTDIAYTYLDPRVKFGEEQ